MYLIFHHDKGAADDSDPLGDVGHRVGERVDNLHQSEGEDVLQPMEGAVHDEEHQQWQGGAVILVVRVLTLFI